MLIYVLVILFEENPSFLAFVNPCFLFLRRKKGFFLFCFFLKNQNLGRGVVGSRKKRTLFKNVKKIFLLKETFSKMKAFLPKKMGIIFRHNKNAWRRYTTSFLDDIRLTFIDFFRFNYTVYHQVRCNYTLYHQVKCNYTLYHQETITSWENTPSYKWSP